MTTEIAVLPALIKKAVATLEGARSSAEILQARAEASVAYSAAKAASRLARAQSAHAEISEACRHTMATALELDCAASIRLASEYDLAQKRGEVRGVGNAVAGDKDRASTVKQLGISSWDICKARRLAAAEKKRPGVVREAIEQRLRDGHDPTRADVRRAITAVFPRRRARKSTVASGTVDLQPATAVGTATLTFSEFSVANVHALVERVRSHYSSSPDIMALCTVCERYLAERLRSERRARADNGASVVEARAP